MVYFLSGFCLTLPPRETQPRTVLIFFFHPLIILSVSRVYYICWWDDRLMLNWKEAILV
jgi:hypothetical protein